MLPELQIWKSSMFKCTETLVLDVITVKEDVEQEETA